MEFKQGTKVYTSDGKDVGSVDRVVLHPKTKEVTDIVVHKGFLFTEDKIIPMGLIESANDERVTLGGTESDITSLLPFEETHYLPLDEPEAGIAEYPLGWASPYYWYEPMGGEIPYANFEAGTGYNHPYRSETEQNIPEDTIALNEGARVITANGQHIGSIKRVFINPENNQATYFIIAEGLIFKEQKLIPVSWIREIKQDEIRLNVGMAIVNKLPEYKERYPAPQN